MQREEQGVVCKGKSLACFWKDINDSLLVGENERVPYIRHDYDKPKWEAVGRILVKGFLEVSYFPTSLSKVFLTSCLFGESVVTEHMLMESFKAYLSKDEAKVVNQIVLKEVAAANDDVLELLSNLDCKHKPCDSNLKEIILEIAQKELIQKPQYVCNCWASILSALQVYFPDVNALCSQYESVIPTNSKVVHILKANPTCSAETDVLGYLKRYIRGLEPSKLSLFLRFTTGSDIMVTDTLHISFTSSEGFGRRPVAHTCGFTLELPSTYANSCELREEFNNILSADNWEMDIV